MEILGFDASHFQGPIDFNKVKASGKAKFVFLKASEGLTYVDPMFVTDFNGAKAAGVNVGAYHFGSFGSVPEALAEAKHFESVIAGKVFTYPIVLDLEQNKSGASKAQLTDAAIAFLEYFENKRYFVMLYSGKSFYQNSLDAARLAPYADWIANYSSTLGMSAGIWQDSESGRIYGVNGAVDIDIAYNDYSCINPKPVPPAPVKPQGIQAIGTIKIVNVSNAALIIDRPSPVSKNLATIGLGKTLPISGSVPGYYEVIWNGQRAYVSSKYAQRV